MTPIVQSITQQHCHRHGLLPRAKRKAHRAKADRRHTTDAKLRWPAPQVLNPIKFWRLLLVVVAFTCFGLVRLNFSTLAPQRAESCDVDSSNVVQQRKSALFAHDSTNTNGSKGHCNVVYVAPSFANAVDPVIGTGVLTVLAAGIGTVLAGRNRTRAETEAERVQRRKTVQQEVEAIAAEYHAILPRAAAKFIGAAYARYSTKYQNSIADQVRAIYKQAVAYGVFIPVEFIFYDLGVRGLKDNRPGLNDLRAVMAAKKIEVALFFATNRLYRKMYRSLKFVEEELVERGIRAIFISQGIDTSDEKRWRTTLAYHAMFDEQAGANSADHIISALIGLVTQGLVSGSIPFGYQGDPIPGRLTRKGKPSRMLVVDPVVAHYVRLIFYWYVHEDLSIDEIARRLNNDPNCPPPPKASIHGWRHPSVIAVLRNTISRGLRAYGWTKRLWISSKDYARQIPRDKPLVEIYDERYRIVTDELFEAAKVKLDADRTTYSKNYLRAENPNPLSVMNGLFICGKHGHRIYFNGTRGRYGLCPCCRAESENIRGIFTHLPRKRAVQKLCSVLAEMILNNATLVDRVISICQQRVENLQKPDSHRVHEVEKRIEKVRKSIDFICRNPGDSHEEELASEQRLREFRQEKAQLEYELMRLREAAARTTIVPDRDRVHELLAQLADVLTHDASEDIEQARQLRRIINLFTGGIIEVHQMGEATAHRGWLQGHFKLHLLKALSSMDAQLPTDAEEEGQVITVDFQREPKPKAVPTADFLKDVKRLYEQNKPIKVIQRLLKCAYKTVDEALGQIYGPDRKTRPHPNARRAQASYEYDKQPLFRVIADRVKALADEGKLIQEIAHELKADRNTIKASLKYWYEVRGLQAPDGRARRKELNAQRKALAYASTSLPLTEGSDAESLLS